jgi:hypothetical protein
MGARKTPEEIEREIAETRARAADTLGAIEQRLSVDHLMRQTTNYLRDNSSAAAFARNLRDSVVSNPWPALVAIAGLGWLIWDASRYEGALERARREQARRRLGLGQHAAPGEAHQVSLAETRPGAQPAGEPPSADQLLGREPADKPAQGSAVAFLRRAPRPTGAASADTFAAAAGTKPGAATEERREPRLE